MILRIIKGDNEKPIKKSLLMFLFYKGYLQHN
ncbi:hypothetical protein FLBR109950_13940 [Flavobacterium branchiophilum]